LGKTRLEHNLEIIEYSSNNVIGEIKKLSFILNNLLEILYSGSTGLYLAIITLVSTYRI